MSPYRIAIDDTTNAIEARARYFRNLVVAVVVLALASFIWATVARTFPPLAALLFVIPVCGFFFFLDAQVLGGWQSRMMDAWVKKDIDFYALGVAVNAIPKLPKDTVTSMLATLPSERDLSSEQKVSSGTREAVTAAVVGIHACQSDAVALKTAVAAVVSGSVIIAAAFRAWEPMLGGVAWILLPMLGKWLKKRRIAVMEERTLAALAKPDFSSKKYGELVERLQWDPIAKSERDGLLKSGLPN